MAEQEFCCEAAAARAIKKVTLSDGFQVGISNLDAIFRQVDELALTDASVIRKELLDRVKACNYVPPRAEKDYSHALYQEYRRHLDSLRENAHR